MDNITAVVSKVLEQLPEDSLQEFYTWGRVVQLELEDGVYFIDFSAHDPSRLLVAGNHDEASFTIKTALATLLALVDGSLDPVEAVVRGDVAINGSLTDALEFSEMLVSAKESLTL